MNFGQSQINPLMIQTQAFEERDNHNIIDFNYFFKPIANNRPPTFNFSSPDCVIYPFEYYLSTINSEEGNRLKSIVNVYLIPSYLNDTLPVSSKKSETKFERSEVINIYLQTNGKGGGVWNSPSTWRDGKVPKNIEFILVIEGDVLIIDSNVRIQSLYLDKNSIVTSDNNTRIIEIQNDIIVSDSASISNFGSGKLDCYITASYDGKSKISIANSAKVSLENLKILGETFFEKGNMDVMNFSAIKQKDFITQTGTVLNIGQKK